MHNYDFIWKSLLWKRILILNLFFRNIYQPNQTISVISFFHKFYSAPCFFEVHQYINLCRMILIICQQNQKKRSLNFYPYRKLMMKNWNSFSGGHFQKIFEIEGAKIFSKTKTTRQQVGNFSHHIITCFWDNIRPNTFF